MELKVLFPDCYQRVLKWNALARSEPPTVEQQVAYTEEEVKEYFVASEEGDLVGVLDAICDIFVTGAYLEHLDPNHRLVSISQKMVEQACNVLGHKLVLECLLSVLDSNDSKFVNIGFAMYGDPKKLHSLVMSEKSRLELQHNIGIHVVMQENYVIFMDDNNKIRKPFCFVEPYIAGIVDNYFGVDHEQA